MAETFERSFRAVKKRIHENKEMTTEGMTSLHHSLRRVDAALAQTWQAMEGRAKTEHLMALEDVVRAEVRTRMKATTDIEQRLRVVREGGPDGGDVPVTSNEMDAFKEGIELFKSEVRMCVCCLVCVICEIFYFYTLFAHTHTHTHIHAHTYTLPTGCQQLREVRRPSNQNLRRSASSAWRLFYTTRTQGASRECRRYY
jgi:head-tail adaptor